MISFLRLARREDEAVLVVCNFTPVPRDGYRVGVPRPGPWRELLNSDAAEYGGGGRGNSGGVEAVPMRYHDLDGSMSLTLPPLSALFFKRGPA